MAGERFGWSTHYSFFPGLDASEIDQYVVKPKTTQRGYRAVTPTFPMFEDLQEEELELYEDEYDAPEDAFGWVPNYYLQSAKIAEEADGGRALSDKAWYAFNAGVAALEFGREMRSRIAGSKARINEESGNVYFKFLARTPGSHFDSMRQLASRIADDNEVDVSAHETNAGLTITFYEPVRSLEQMGRLFPARQNARLEPAGPADPGLLVTSSGSSGMRGARTPFASSLHGSEVAPKPQYTRYGSNGPNGQGRGGVVRTRYMEYEGSEMGAAVIGVAALAVMYRCLGGEPLF